ncbi:hypothetical protein F5X99DRAFT_217629 [Biscogniauxia marginata]|nr:hypothetical protein F5X99DRAFT_217629 [Biscogniauxia marginata]
MHASSMMKRLTRPHRLFKFGLFSNYGLFSKKEKIIPKDGLPRSVQNALTRLEGVTEKKTKRDSQIEPADAECPICLGCLFANERQTSKQTENEIDLESGRGISRTATTASNTTCTTTTAGDEKRQSMQPINDGVLKMKRCRHTFHSRCLATWFLNKKYDCPVCRTPYYQPMPEEPSDEDGAYRYRREQDEYFYRNQLGYSLMPFF